MATITRENIGELNEKLTVTVGREDYLPAFEKTLKQYGRTASLPGFRKGMVPAGLIRKMHGQAVLTEEVLKAVEKELTRYMAEEKLDIFAQPLPLPESDADKIDVNRPAEYSFRFEVGLKPQFQLPDLSQEKLPEYQITVSEEMVDQQIEKLQTAFGKKKETEPEPAEAGSAPGEQAGESGETQARQSQAEPQIEKAELNEELFRAAYPGKDINTLEAFREQVRSEIAGYWETQSRHQFQHALFHLLIDKTDIPFPEPFLRRWLQVSGEKPRSAEEVEKEFPGFLNNLKWTLISDRIAEEQGLQVQPEELKDFARNQLFGYMGMQMLDDEQPWVEQYVQKMMQDRRFLEDAFHRIRTDKVFAWAAGQVQHEQVTVTAEEFARMAEEHQHTHH